MMDFPASPTVGQIFTPSGGPSYMWDGSKWNAVAQANALLAANNLSDVANAATARANLGLGSGQLGGLRNMIINGNFEVDVTWGFQVNAVLTGVNYFGADRWNVQATTASKLNSCAGVSAALGGLTGLMRVQQLSLVSTVPSLAAGDFYMIQQRIEGINFANRTGFGSPWALPVTVSFWAFATAGGTFPLALRNGAGNRSYVATFTLTANVWSKITITIPGDTTGTWPADNTLGAILSFGLAMGSTYQASSANTWLAGNFITAPGCTNFMATASNVFYLGQVQMEVGSTATPYEHRGVGLETTLCERYYRRITGVNAANVQLYGYGAGGGAIQNLITFPSMRVTPNGARSGIIGAWTYSNASAVTIMITTPQSAYIFATVTATGSASAQAPASGGFALDAEL